MTTAIAKEQTAAKEAAKCLQLPEAFLKEMKQILGGEFSQFLSSYENSPFRGIRRNPLKCSEDELFAVLPFSAEHAPFSPLSYYAPADLRPGSLPAHHAGFFYAQEPSAASAVTLLDPRPGEKILDLCAAPGGKSTQIAGLLEGQGLLVSNEVVRSRCDILSSNLERMGVRNAVVMNCRPDRLAAALPGYFDKVLVDAPCSGEGMFRRDPDAILQWNPNSPASCAARQKEILSSAASLLRPGGILVYSTCTFSFEENEGTVEAFLAAHPEFALHPSGVCFGESVLGGCGTRIYPMHGGEGHFAVKLQKKDGEEPYIPPYDYRPLPTALQKMTESLLLECFTGDPSTLTFAFLGGSSRRELPEEGKILVLPSGMPDFAGLSPVRMGYELAVLKGKRLEPCHAAFLARKGRECRNVLSFSAEDPLLAAFLRGEEISCTTTQSYTAVCLNGIPCGFGKASGGRLKNKYPKGLRNHR